MKPYLFFFILVFLCVSMAAKTTPVDLSGTWKGTYINRHGNMDSLSSGVYQINDSIFGTVSEGSNTSRIYGKISAANDSLFATVISKSGTITKAKCKILVGDSISFSYASLDSSSYGHGGVKKTSSTRTLIVHYNYTGNKLVSFDAPLGIRIFDNPAVYTSQPIKTFEFTSKSGTAYLTGIPDDTIFTIMHTGYSDSMAMFQPYIMSITVYGNLATNEVDTIAIEDGKAKEITLNFDDSYTYTIPAMFPNGKMNYYKSVDLPYSPKCIAIDKSKNIYVVSETSGKIYKYNSDIEIQDTLKNNIGNYIYADQIKYAADGSFYTLYGNQINHYNAAHLLLQSLAVTGSPSDLAIDGNGNVFYASKTEILKYSADLAPITSLTLSKIKTDYSYINVVCEIRSIAFDKNNKIIIGIDDIDEEGDIRKDGLVFYNNSLTTFDRSIQEEWLINNPINCEADTANNVFVISYWHDGFTMYNASDERSKASYYVNIEGTQNGAMSGARDLAVVGSTIYVVEDDNNRVSIFGTTCPNPLVGTNNVEICQGNSYLWHGKQYTLQGTYYDSLKTKTGCDSIFKLVLQVKSVPAKPIVTAVTNKAQLTTSASGSLQWYNSNGTGVSSGTNPILDVTNYTQKYYVITSVNSCFSSQSESVGLHDLVCSSTLLYSQTGEICAGDTYSWHNRQLIRTGVYYDSLKTTFGCDSVFKLTLAVKPSPAKPTISVVANTGQLKTEASGSHFWFPKNGLTIVGAEDGTLEVSNIYLKYYTKTMINGCVSEASDTVSLHDLVCVSSLLYTENKELCTGEAYTWHGKQLNKTGNYYDSLKTRFGCDSIFKLVLTVNTIPSKPTISAVANKAQLKAEGSGSVTWFTLNSLAINGGSSTILEVADVNKQYYAKTIMNGCSSDASDTVSLHELVCTSTLLYNESKEICANEPLTWHGKTLKLGGTYYDSLKTAFGCDSIFKLILSVKSVPAKPTISAIASLGQLKTEATGSHLWFPLKGLTIVGAEDGTLEVSNVYLKYYTKTMINGCLSEASDTVSLHDLVCTTPKLYSEQKELCAGENYTWRGKQFNKSGNYYDSLKTFFGCDSIFKLELTIKPEPVKPIVIFDESNKQLISGALEANQWYSVSKGILTNETSTTLKNIKVGEEYYVIAAINGCSIRSSNSVKIENFDYTTEYNSENKISVYPNPALDKLKVSLPNDFKLHAVIITDLSGKQIKQFAQKDLSGFISLNITDLTNGVYNVTLYTNKGKYNYLITKSLK